LSVVVGGESVGRGASEPDRRVEEGVIVPFRRAADLAGLAAKLEGLGASLTVEAPGQPTLQVGPEPDRTRVVFRDPSTVRALLRGDHLALAEAYLAERVDIEGELRQALFVTDALDLGPASRFQTLGVALRAFLDRRRFHRQSVSEHYDRPPDFFLAWLDPWRSYTHGFYASPDESLHDAQTRKLRFALDALGAKPGDRVLDVGCGWGSFLEFAGRQGVRVHGITLSRDQADYVAGRIADEGLPCSVQYVDFLDFRPEETFAGAVFMGSLEHLPHYEYLASFLGRYLRSGARMYADFVTSREGRLQGAFLRKYIFPGVSGYVELPELLGALHRAGFNARELGDDTLCCAYTVRDWALALEGSRDQLVGLAGEATVRAFLLYLWSSYHFLETNRTQAYHLVVSQTPGGWSGAERA